jgi:SAM-dependent methyltransferase
LKAKGILRIPKLLAANRRAPASRAGFLRYRCNICDQGCETRVTELAREEPSCLRCGSTVRARSVIRVLSMELFGVSLPLSEFPMKPDIRGIGLSDWERYAVPLARKLNYTNTYYHTEPRFDILSDLEPELEGTLDFLLASDVFEHLAPPVSQAFANCRRLLKSSGVLVFTTPYTRDGVTTEYYPELDSYEVIEVDGQHILKNVTRDGREQTFKDLIFHGGEGATVEMRLFSAASLQEEFRQAGFGQVKTYSDPDFAHGIYWNLDWSGGSFPISARK